MNLRASMTTALRSPKEERSACNRRMNKHKLRDTSRRCADLVLADSFKLGVVLDSPADMP